MYMVECPQFKLCLTTVYGRKGTTPSSTPKLFFSALALFLSFLYFTSLLSRILNPIEARLFRGLDFRLLSAIYLD